MGKKLIKNLPVQIAFAISQINKLPENKKYRLLDIGSADMQIKRYLKENIVYESLDYKQWSNCPNPTYKFNLDEITNKKLPIKNESYDIVVCLDTLEHTLYPDKIMDEIIRIAKKDAIFVLSIPNEYNLYLRLNYLMGRKVPIHEAFETVNKHLHIHLPRVKDILTFFSRWVRIKKIDYGWHSRIVLMDGGIKRTILLPIDFLFKFMAKIYPSLFCRTVAIIGIKNR